MHLLSFEVKELKKWLVDNNQKAFRLKQIFDWIFQRNVLSFDEMTNLSNDLIKSLKKSFELPSIKLIEKKESKDKETTKYLFQLHDKKLIESVLILSKDRRTLCVSSQVGCEVRCSFCASGKNGFFRNLQAYEIIEQLLVVNSLCDEKINHVVFMGMGEPLNNFKEVIKAIKIISNEDYFNISQRKISLSTVGIPEKIRMLKELDLKINLILSLHSPNDLLRRKLIPYSKKYRLADILKEVKKYQKSTKRDVSFEYILIDDFNDKIAHADELSKILDKKHININLIPYNPIEGLKYKRSRNERIKAFKEHLLKKGFVVTQRYTKGADIAAACGQLASLNKKNN